MRNNSCLLVCTLIGIACGCGCRKQDPAPTAQPPNAAREPAPEYVVAMVNGTPLTWAEMEKRAQGFLNDDVESNHLIIPSNRMDEAKTHFRRKSINAFSFKTIMLDEAVKQRLSLTAADRAEGLKALAQTLKIRNWTNDDFFLKGPMDEATMRREFDDGMLIDKLLKLNVRNRLKISDQEVADAVTTLQATNDLKRVRLEQIRKQLVDGADFADVARNVSECQSAKQGGDLGEITRGKMNKAFEEAAFALAVGAISPVVQTRFGFHLIKVTSHTPQTAATDSTPEVPETIRVSHILLKHIDINRKRITDSILKAKFKAGVDAYYRDLKAKANLECFLFEDLFK